MYSKGLLTAIILSTFLQVVDAVQASGWEFFVGIVFGFVVFVSLLFFLRYYIWDQKCAPKQKTEDEDEEQPKRKKDRKRTKANSSWAQGHLQGQSNQQQHHPPPMTNQVHPQGSNPFAANAAAASHGQSQASNPFAANAAAAQGQPQSSNPFAVAAQGV